MKEFKLVITDDAKANLCKYLLYIKNQFSNPQAVRDVRDDFYQTAASLRTLADTIRQPSNEKMKQKGLKRINFISHDYFLIFRLKETKIEVVQMFHFLEDYENRLR